MGDHRGTFGPAFRRMAYPRVVSLCDFAARIAPEVPDGATIAVVSGGADEPELRLLSGREVAVLSYDDDARFDLGRDWNDTYGAFDFVLCNQVLEHVFDPLRAMRNLARITKPGGAVYVSIPTINKVHGLPDFYSAGYYPTWLEQAFAHASLEPKHISFWGSRKYLSGFHWPTEKELRRGFHNWRDFVDWQRPFVDGRTFSSNDRWITDTWGLAVKPS